MKLDPRRPELLTEEQVMLSGQQTWHASQGRNSN